MDRLISTIETASWDDLVPAIKALAERVYGHRREHSGYVPLSVFEYLLGMGGISASVQIVDEVIDEGGNRLGFALKLREGNEVGWGGLYHSTCTTVRMTDHPDEALARDTRETFGEDREEQLEFLGNVINHETERRSSCITLLYRRRVKLEDLKGFVGSWTVFSEEEIRARDPRIVNYNWDQLAYVMDEHRAPFAFFDTVAGVREGFI